MVRSSTPAVDPASGQSFSRTAVLRSKAWTLCPPSIAKAQIVFPDVGFRVGELRNLGVPGDSLAGILAWYSLIHLQPVELPAVLSEFARCIMPGGGLLLGFFEGAAVEAFPHAVTPAYYWPIDEMVQHLDAAGLETIETQTRVDPGHRPHAAIVARRTTT